MYDIRTKARLKVEDVAVKQLESAIWMYAYDYDEVAVHTVVGAAFELYSKRLELASFKDDVTKYIKPEKRKAFFSLWNRPYNFFKHGEHQKQPLEFIDYEEETVELPLYLACEANYFGPTEYRLNSANVYRIYFFLKNPDLFEEPFYEQHFIEPERAKGLVMNEIRNKKALRLWLNIQGHTFMNGTDTPYRDVAKAD